MGAIRQFYGGTGVPLVIDGDPSAPGRAWLSQRARLTGWLGSLPDDEWSGPTRCAEWDVTHLVRHLASGSQFLGYSLHQAASGTPSSLLRDFDTHTTVQAAAAMLGDLTPAGARAALAGADASVGREIDAVSGDGWLARAEAPPGHLPSYLAVSHFLFDSWVHEYDLMLPRDELPPAEVAEVGPVVAYLVGLAAIVSLCEVSLDVRLAEPDVRLGVLVEDGAVRVTPGSTPVGGAVVEGTVRDLVDRTTGRSSGPVTGDAAGLAALDGLAAVLAG